MMLKRGDVFSIEVKAGKAYFQYVEKLPSFGPLIRVLPGVFSASPDFDVLVPSPSNFWVFFPISAALKNRVIDKIGNYPLPDHSKTKPVFRTGMVDPRTGRVEKWWFWDGEKSWEVGQISDDERKLPIRGVWNDTLLIQRINEGWLPEKDQR
ncbi:MULTISPECIES: hypothetical protein [unclassified Pseudomonas]|uniref:hypothetical protein n=1 Tax=unclassified Pseudomonas TaxID=196821 RepID=UPI00384F6B7F